MYEQAFAERKAQPTATHYYNAACSWALAGNKDKAFRYLDQATTAGWDNVPHLKQDADLGSLRTDARWQPMLAKLEATRAKAEAQYNLPLKRELEAIYATGQAIRLKIDSVEKKLGMQAAQSQALLDEMDAVDERNTARVTAIIEQYGWPGQSMVGRLGSTAAFLVIQHARPSVQRKYLPLMREAASKGELAKSSLALLEDRILVEQGKPQLYGSQLRPSTATGKYELEPIEDEAHVDERRAAVGLGPLREYVKHWGLEYKPQSSATKP
ncbi:hypothetical protein ASU33_00120 [Solirubrum puertoriconensis]|uniref:Uncharacterized protein n=1 Tax=Solirubrum puertoriconensis TaxID=1751427 RepID=A0A9X0L3Z7_SOLP1|nr:hypothetical protein ASU33_00120 [Solirubrum puertoriconensis]